MEQVKWQNLLKSKVRNLDQYDQSELIEELYQYQLTYNELYRKFVHTWKGKDFIPKSIVEIPFLPISFFKSYKITSCPSHSNHTIFRSSGTTSQNRSQHYVQDVDFYLQTAKTIFEKEYGKLEDYIVLALLPGYQERNDSSLIAMTKFFIQESGHSTSGFYLNKEEQLVDIITNAQFYNRKIVLLGVSFALLQLVDQYKLRLDDANTIFMETGGMKGKGPEWTKDELHAYFRKKTGLQTIHSEYGMTEMQSQSYGKNKLFSINRYLTPVISNLLDPTEIQPDGKAGILNFIDMANIDSCCFIATEDMGVKHGASSFELLGRVDHAEIRGCNLLVSDLK